MARATLFTISSQILRRPDEPDSFSSVGVGLIVVVSVLFFFKVNDTVLLSTLPLITQVDEEKKPSVHKRGSHGRQRCETRRRACAASYCRLTCPRI